MALNALPVKRQIIAKQYLGNKSLTSERWSVRFRSCSTIASERFDRRGVIPVAPRRAPTFCIHGVLPMAQVTSKGQIVETATEARAGERGPSMLVVLTVSTVAAAVIFAALWYYFLR